MILFHHRASAKQNLDNYLQEKVGGSPAFRFASEEVIWFNSQRLAANDKVSLDARRGRVLACQNVV